MQPRLPTTTELAFQHATTVLLQHRFSVLSTLLVLSLGLGICVPDIKVNNANRQWFHKSDETVERLERFEQRFGTDKFIFILLEMPDVFTAEGIETLRRMEHALSLVEYEGEPAFSRISHIGNATVIRTTEDGLDVSQLARNVDFTPKILETMRRLAHESVRFEGFLISKNDKAAGIVAELRVLHGDAQFHPAVVSAVQLAVRNLQEANLRISLGGGPLINVEMDRLTLHETRYFGLLGLVFMGLAVFVIFRRFGAVLLSFATVALTLAWTLGAMGIIGRPISVVHIILPMMLLVVATSDVVHVFSHYERERRLKRDKNAAISNAMGQVGVPCSLTSVTTAAGMLSLMLAPIPPIQSLGLYAAIGVIAALLITLVFVPIALSFQSEKPVNRPKSAPFLERGLLAIGRMGTTRPRVIVALGAVFIGTCIYLSTLVQIETNLVDTFHKEHPTRVQMEHIDTTLGGTGSLQAIIDTGMPGGVKDPAFLNQLSRWENWLKQETPNVLKTFSVVDLIREMNAVLTGKNPHTAPLPTSQPAIAQEFLLYENSDPEGLFRIVTEDYRYARVDIRTVTGGSHAAQVVIDAAQHKAAEIFGSDSTLEITGLAHLFVQLTHHISLSQIRSYSAAFVVIALVMMLILKSISLGTLSMIPNLLPVAVTLGWMGWAAVPLDFFTLLVACIAIGIAVDDTIHFLLRFRSEFTHCGSYKLATERTLVTTGRAMASTTLILCAGFSMFALSELRSISVFGLLVAMALVSALMADLLLLPALLKILKPFGPEKTR